MGSGRRHGTRVAGCRDRWHARSRAGARCRAEIAEKLEDPNIHLPHGTVIDSKAALSPGIRVTELDPRRSVMWPVDGRPIGKAAELDVPRTFRVSTTALVGYSYDGTVLVDLIVIA